MSETYIVCEVFDAIREPLSVGDEVTRVASLLLQPAVVYVDVLIPKSGVALGHHKVGHRAEQAIADAIIGIVFAVCVAPEPLPAEPAHRGRPREAIL